MKTKEILLKVSFFIFLIITIIGACFKIYQRNGTNVSNWIINIYMFHYSFTF